MKPGYRLTGRVETGELAELYRAERGDEQVVVKLFHARTTDAAYARELAETARALNSVRTPGVVRVLELGLAHRRLAVVQEAVAGVTLGQAIQRLNTREVVLPAPLALTWVVELLTIIQAAHDAGVVHGALTPGNVHVSDGGQLFVSDFGALRALDAVPALKKAFGTRGRASYRAAEVARGEPPGPASDVYSAGAIAYELLTLREPSAGRAAAVSTRHEAPVPPSRLDRRINSRLDPIILRALYPSPARRYRSCGELAAAIRGYYVESGGLPSRDDARRFVAELFPNEVSVAALGPVPFGELFALDEVEGADLAALPADLGPTGPRPSFSGAGVPAGGEWTNGVETVPGPDTERGLGVASPETLPAGLQVAGEWHAPPGAAPARKADGHRGPAGWGRRALKRVRAMADLPGEADRSATVQETRAVAADTREVPAQSIPATFVDKPREPGDAPRPDSVGQVPVPRRRPRTFAIAVVAGAAAAALVVLVIAARGPSARKGQASPRAAMGYLTIQTDLPAVVTIDGRWAGQGTPLLKFPVAPGTVRIELVAPSTGERREFSLTVEPGQTVKVDERFGRPRPPR